MTKLSMVMVAFAVSSCAPEPPSDPAGPVAHEGVGTVISVEREMVLIDHEDIDGFMDAMTMTFPVADPALLTGVEKGSRVRFRVVVDGASYTIDRIEIVARE